MLSLHRNTMTKSSPNSQSFPRNGLYFCSALLLFCAIVIAKRDDAPLVQYQSETFSHLKPYATFRDFYPHYLQEHSQVVTRLWHYVGTSLFLIYLAYTPGLILPIITAGFSGYAVVPFFRHVSTGIFEAAILGLVYFTSGKMFVRSWKSVITPLIIGYGFAWIGHFFFENNKPATFIYPTYSLMGDFHMIYDAVVNQRP